MVSLAERRRAVEYLRSEYAVSERHACRALQLHRSTCRYQPRRESIDQALRQVVRLSGRYPCWGYRKIYELAKPDVSVSRERVRLIRRREGLQVVTRRRKRRVLGKTTQWVHRALYPNHVWSYDFVFDQTDDARTLKFLTIVDEFTRRGFDIHCSRSITAGDVVRVLARLFARYGSPEFIRSDNGTELISSTILGLPVGASLLVSVTRCRLGWRRYKVAVTGGGSCISDCLS